MSQSTTVYSMLMDCSRSLTGTFTQRDILMWVRAHYPEIREATLRAHVQALTSNATNRERNHPILGSRPPLFDRVSHGVYRVHVAGSSEAPSPGSLSEPRIPSAERTLRQAIGVRRNGHATRPTADIILVSCVKSKRHTGSAAKDLYTSALFAKEREYAERSKVPWYILSAKYGLVGPDERIEPYELYLPTTSPDYQRAWGSQAIRQLEAREGPLRGRMIEIHAGATYLRAVRAGLTALGAIVTEPLDGLRMGERLAWYSSSQLPAADRLLQPEIDASEVQRMVDALRDDSTALTPSAFLATGGAGLKVPGLYSWWVDHEGASTLSHGLELELAPGLIYAGLAGATHWPSGKRSTNTLWLRIQSMHLGKKAKFSTFRLTLGSILASAVGSNQIDEVALSDWMHFHLRVVTAPYVDADVLGIVETEVLSEIDPPLNLQGMRKSDLRTRLTALRKAATTDSAGG